ncbi:DUF5060 domain-containing protein [Mangrovibacterium sp.]|uniref:DUF5060 domain-containing protein n=1 Tax=Mangrovibacterium sp. TaxID=1961364 RepID=UPI003561471B
MRNSILIFLALVLSTYCCTTTQPKTRVGLYRTFEQALENKSPYTNRFTDVELNCTFTAPSGKKTEFIGFFDGDGAGGGNKESGSIWKIRFIPDEVGEWQYQWIWSDGTPGGKSSFVCDTTNAGKGILRAYQDNPRWLAYNGTDPVWLKSYYESGHGSIAQPFDWVTANVYQPMIDRGYNHLQVNWLLSLCCFTQIYHDGPPPPTQDLALYTDGDASGTMRLDVWKMMEQHVSWLNDRNIGLHLFLGFDGSKNEGPEWTNLSDDEKDFLVRYTVARLAPYANIAGWGFVWEVPGNREDSELGWARLVQKYDVFDHLRTYEDEHPIENEYNRPEYNFAAIENHSIFSEDRNADRPYWKEAWTHHEACLAGYFPGKPVYMIEGNALWRRFWQQRTNATLADLRQSAWACVTAGASFNWCGHAGEDSLVARGPEGLPFFDDGNPYEASARQIDLLSNIMNTEVQFYTMNPADSLLSGCDSKAVWCLAEPSRQYLVFSIAGKPFNLQVEKGNYASCKWINTINGDIQTNAPISVATNETILFSPPDQQNDWVLLIK